MAQGRLFWLPLIALASLRFAHWGAPFTEDEAFMVRVYAAHPLAEIATRFEAPNNHVFLAMLLHAVDALSPMELFVSLKHPGLLQLLSILPSIGSVAILYRVAAASLSARTAALAAGALGVSYWHLLYSHMLRGYSLSCFLLLAGVWVLQESLLKKRPRLLPLLVPLLAAFNYTVASNLYFSLGLCLWAAAWALTEERLDLAPLSALGGGAALTALLYAPLFEQLRAAAQQTPALAGRWALSSARLENAYLVLGSTAAYRAFFLCVCACGLWSGFGRGRRGAFLPSLAVALIAAPLAATAAQGIVIPFARAYIPLLPFWAVLFALGLEGLWAPVGRLLPGAAAPYALAGLIALPSLGELRRFLAWNRGMDLRGVMADVVARAREIDDYVLIYPSETPDSAAGKLEWEYYAFAAGMAPQVQAVAGGDQPYLLRKQYFVAAADEPSARAALQRSRIDGLFMRRLKLLAPHGRLRLYGLAMDDGLMRDYEATSADERAPPALRAQALTGLAFAYADAERLEQAALLLERAKVLAPKDPRVRFLLAKTRYLELDDARAAAELAWVVANDTGNARAPLYLADALAGLGRAAEARRWYGWYEREARGTPAGAWLLGERAAMGAKDAAGPRRPPAGAQEWAAAARAYQDRGSYERSVVAWRRAMRLHPTVDTWLGLARAHAGLQEHVAAEKILKRALAAGAPEENRLALAQVLFYKRALGEAREELERFLRGSPGHGEALGLQRKVKRLS